VVYGTPALDKDRVYVADLEGFVHAIDRHSGRLIWSKRHATFSVEQPVLLHDGILYFGAWDGFVYAVDARDGSLKWKAQGPAGYRDDPKYKSRYYGPADCPPVIIGDRLFVVDRAYALGSYSLTGEYLGEIAAGVSGIALSEDGQSLYARGSERGLARYGAEGKEVWSNPVKLGRFPIPPTEVGGRVFVCSNRGLLTVHDAARGDILGRYQVTPQAHVMAPVAADRAGRAYVAGMDGSLTRCVFAAGQESGHASR
jgi:outer membrane protein assembly factor BamB